MYSIPAIIFAGGKSSRMGRDKALLPFGNEPTMTHFQYQKLHKLFDRVYISTKEDKFDIAYPLIKDRYTVSSPLVGLISLFETLECDFAFILSVDAPLVDETIIDALIQKMKEGEEYDAIIAKSPKGIEPLCGIYHSTILPLAKQYLKEDKHKLTALLKEANTHLLSFSDEKAFANLNTPQEYRATF